MIATLYDTFKHWAATGSVWLVSDTHFNDADTRLMDSNWPEPEEQLKILQSFIHKNDTLVHLGDIGDPKYLKKIPGYKVLCLGNHDYTATKFKLYFDEIYTGPLMISDKIILSHEPIDPLPEYLFNIHGHDHNKNHTKDEHHLNLAANVVNYQPVSLGKLIKDGLLSGVHNIHRVTIDNAR